MIKNIILKLHRILGSLMSLIFVIWFISGFVMIFSGFPHANRYEITNNLQTIDVTDSIKQFPLITYPKAKDIKLYKIGGQSVYSFNTSNGRHIIDSYSYSAVDSITKQAADSVIATIYNKPVRYTETIEIQDQWIPWSHFSDRLPATIYHLDDEDDSRIYISMVTGDIIQETTSYNRWMARVGAIPHWFYFKSLRLKKGLWKDVVIWISAIGVIMCVTGIIIGLVRYTVRRRGRKRAGTPYKKRWYRIHHIVGLVFGLFTFTFVFSGMMSLADVPEWISPVKNKTDYRLEWNGNSIDASEYKLSVSDLINSYNGCNIKMVEWNTVLGEPCYYVYTNNNKYPLIINATNSSGELSIINQEVINRQLKKVFAEDVKRVEILTESDNYYGRYDGAEYPITKVYMNDENESWLYINNRTAKARYVINKNSRIRRWVYNALHSFDLKVFNKHNWLRITLLIIVSIGGLIISISGVVLSVKYLKRRIKNYRR